MFLARDFFDDSVAELRAWLNTPPKPLASIEREHRGACVVLRANADLAMPWPEKVRAALRTRVKG